MTLLTAADTNPEAAAAAAAPWQATHHTDYRAVLAHPGVEAVVVVDPLEYLHAEPSPPPAAAGKHVLCEKPMAPSLLRRRTA